VTVSGDTTAPTISGVGASSITGSGATINWTTNEASDTQVEYGTSTGYGSSTSLASTLVTNHSATLTGLQPSKLYHYRVKSRDAASNLATSADFTFTTASDTTAPTISGVETSSVTASAATIIWATDETSDTQVEYGTTAKYGSSTYVASALVTNHSVNLSGLQTSTLYHYRVKSRDGSGNLATSADFSFTTANNGSAPVISSVGASSITPTSAKINWITDKASDSQVEYWTADGYNNSTMPVGPLATTHAVLLSNLQPSKTYHYRVKSRDAGGNLATSSDQTFTTAAASDNGFTKIMLSSVGTSAVTIDWSTSKPTSGVIEFGVVAVSDHRATDLAITMKHSTQLKGLSPSTLYHYRITATPIDNNSITSAILTFKTSDQLNQQAKPSSQAVFIPSIVENPGFRTNLGINNTGTSTANVSITLVDKRGMALGTKTLQVDPKGLKQINSMARSLLDTMGNGMEGSVYLESDQPISAWASQIENTTNDPSLLLGKRNGATKLLIPSAANVSSFSSSLVIMNVGTDSSLVNLKAYDVSGSVLGQTSAPLSIDPNGVLSFDNVLKTLGVNGKYGPLEITSVNNMPLIASSRVSSTTKTGGFFEGLKYSDASMIQIVPQIIDTDHLRTNLGINNINAQPALVKVKLMSQDGAELAAQEVVVQPNGLSQINNVARQLLGQPAVSNFEGYIRLESNHPIFGWAAVIDNVTNDPGFAQGQKQGSIGLLLDSTANVGSFKSSLVIVNTGEGDALVDIVSHDTTGNVTGERRNLLIPAQGYFSNTNILEHVGVENNFGPLEVISTNGQPVIATSRVYSDAGPSGFFQGQDLK
jgi:phosphodiesterase/alkaline phosphatase D-like protein